MKRGVVSLPCKMKSIKDSLIMEDYLYRVDLNYFALYWDELIIPTSNIFAVGIAGEEDFINAGFLSRPYNISSGNNTNVDIVNIYSGAQISTLDSLRKSRSDVDWRLNHIGSSLGVSGDDTVKKETLRLELYGVLPVPDESVHVQDILKFKEKRRSELEALHNYFDELYLEVLSSGDFNLKRAKAFAQLKNSIKDLRKLNKHGWRSPIRFDTSAVFECDIKSLISGGLAFKSIYDACHGNVVESLLTGATALVGEGILRLKPQIQSVRRGVSPQMAYLSKAKSIGFIKDFGGD